MGRTPWPDSVRQCGPGSGVPQVGWVRGCGDAHAGIRYGVGSPPGRPDPCCRCVPLAAAGDGFATTAALAAFTFILRLGALLSRFPFCSLFAMADQPSHVLPMLPWAEGTRRPTPRFEAGLVRGPAASQGATSPNPRTNRAFRVRCSAPRRCCSGSPRFLPKRCSSGPGLMWRAPARSR